MNEPLTGRYLLKAAPHDLQAWMVQADHDGMSFAAWLRTLAHNQTTSPQQLTPTKPTPNRPRRRTPPPQPAQALQSAQHTAHENYTALRERARQLAHDEGVCTADVGKGLRCRLCGKIH